MGGSGSHRHGQPNKREAHTERPSWRAFAGGATARIGESSFTPRDHEAQAEVIEDGDDKAQCN